MSFEMPGWSGYQRSPVKSIGWVLKAGKSIYRVWTAYKLKNLRGKGHDIIIAGKDQYSQIPLNKDIIKNLKRIK